MKTDFRFWLFVAGLALAFVALVPLPDGLLPATATKAVHYVCAWLYFVVHGAYAALITGHADLPSPPIAPPVERRED